MTFGDMCHDVGPPVAAVGVDVNTNEDGDPITWVYRILGQNGLDGVDPVRRLAVGDGVETGEQFRTARPISAAIGLMALYIRTSENIHRS
jgi:hypothetical protein